MAKIKLFIVEDEIIIATNLKNLLSGLGYDVLGINGKGEKAIESIHALAADNNQPDIILVDIRLAGQMDGIETAKVLSEQHPCGIIFLTSINNKEILDKSLLVKPYALLFKPVDIEQLRTTIELFNYLRNLEISQTKAVADLKLEVELRGKAEKETQLFFQDKIKAESKVNQLHRHKQQIETDLINRELATSSIFIAQKNKIIGLIRKDVNRQLRQGKNITKGDFVKILKTIDEKVKFENDWYRIKAHFEAIHPGFFSRLREKFPKLTPNDHKLCALLRMNLSTKEISQILKITAPSTEISRIRLRRKMSLSRDVNLIQFICMI